MTLAPGPRRRRDGADSRRGWTRAVAWLRAEQAPAGWWKGELETNVTMDAEDLLLREFLGIRTAAETDGGSPLDPQPQQRADGTWATFDGGPGDLSTTVEAWVALRLAGDAARRAAPAPGAGVRPGRAAASSAPGSSPGSGWRCSACGRGTSCRPCRPSWCCCRPGSPLNVYDWACWARQTVVPLTVVATLRPVPAAAVRRSTSCAPARPAPPLAPAASWAGAFERLDRVLHAYSRAAAAGRCAGTPCAGPADWILARQEADGSWGGIQPPWVYSLLALHLLGYPLDAPAVRAGLGRPGGLRRPRADPGRCRAPARGLPVAGLGHRPGPDRAARRRGRAGRRDGRPGPPTGCSPRRSGSPGDWSVRRPGLAPGGWAFEFDNDGYPDIDDTAEVVLALRRVGTGPRSRGPPRRSTAAVEWTAGMQSRDGGWGAFDADNTRTLADRAAVLRLRRGHRPAVRRRHRARRGDARRRRAGRHARPAGAGCAGCSTPRSRTARGSAAGAPTTSTAPARSSRRWSPPGSTPATPAVRRAVALARARTRTPTAAGARTCAPTATRPGSAAARPTASQTAWALLALLAAGERRRGGASAASRWLVETQRADGTWDEDRSSPAPASRATSTSTTTCTGWCSRCRRWAATCAAGRVTARGAARGRDRAARSSGPRWPGVLDGAPVVRTGMGPRRAGRGGPAGAAPVAASPGSPVAWPPRCAPGDVVVATRSCHDGAAHAAARPRRCSPVRCAGPACGCTRPDRAQRPRSCDRRRAGPPWPRPGRSPSTWSPACARRAPPRRAPLAVVRVVVDTADAPLVRPGTLRRGRAALRGAAARPRRCCAPGPPPLGDREVCWPRRGRSAPASSGRSTSSSGRCAARRARSTSAGRSCTTPTSCATSQRRGAVFVDELDEVPARQPWSCSPRTASRRPCARRPPRATCDVIDATCPLVAKVHTEVRRFAARGDTVLLIGHADHEEVEGTLGEAPGRRRASSRTPTRPARGRAPRPGPGRVRHADHAGRRRGASRSPRCCAAGSRPDRRRATDDICYATTNRQRAVRARRPATATSCSSSARPTPRTRAASSRSPQREGTPAHLVEDAERGRPGLAGRRAAGSASPPARRPRRTSSTSSSTACRGLGPRPASASSASPTRTSRSPCPKEVWLNGHARCARASGSARTC